MFSRYFVLILFVLPTLGHSARFDTRSVGALVEDCSGKIVRFSRRKYHEISALVYGAEITGSRRITSLTSYPRRELAKSPEIMNYLKTHPVFVSVTTSPTRLPHLLKIIKGLDTTNVTEVLVVLPERFGRDGREYDIPKELADYPKVRILRIPVDLGPATKLVPAVRWLSERKDQPLVITIDDDMIYPAGMVNEMITASARFPESAIGGAGVPLSYWGINDIPSEAELDRFLSEDLSMRKVDVVEGYAAIVYPVKKVPFETIQSWAALSAECRYSDDLIISLALRNAGIDRFEMRSFYYSRDYLYQLPHGFLPDALHRGAGLESGLTAGMLSNPNEQKYRQAYLELRKTNLIQ